MFYEKFWDSLSGNEKQIFKYLGIAFLFIAYMALVEGGLPEIDYDLNFSALHIPASWSLP